MKKENINNKNVEQDYFDILRNIQKSPRNNQRDLAKSLGFSLGKLNYCIRELQKKGLIKIENFKQKENKINYIKYMLTPQGIMLRTKLTMSFMKRKMKEYDELKKELEKIR